MKISNFITIKGYNAGKNGNLLVSLDENFSLYHVDTLGGLFKNKPKEFDITGDATLCMVPEGAAKEFVNKNVDDKTSSDYVIVVSSHFQKLTNKSQLILLTKLNASAVVFDKSCNKANTGSESKIDIGESIDSCRIAGNLAAMEEFGAVRASWTINKEQKRTNRSTFKAGRSLHRVYRTNKNAEAIAKGLGIFDTLDELIDEDESLESSDEFKPNDSEPAATPNDNANPKPKPAV